MKRIFYRAFMLSLLAAMLCGLGYAGYIVIIVLNGPYDKPTGEQETKQATQQLLTRSSLEDSETQIRRAVQQITATGSELVPGMEWKQDGDREQSGCDKPYDQTEGLTLHLQDYVSDTPIPDSAWPTYLDRARQIATRAGATTQETMDDRPGHKEVWFSNPDDGTVIKVGYQAATVISATVGCHLPRNQLMAPPHPTS
jgi:hypothetical protein